MYILNIYEAVTNSDYVVITDTQDDVDDNGRNW